MGDDALALQAAVDADQAGAEDLAAVSFELVRPDDDIGDTGLVFQGQEDHPLGGAGALTDQHQPGDNDSRIVRGAQQLTIWQDAFGCQAAPKQRDGVTL